MEQKTTCPVTGYIEVNGLGRIPILGVKMMDDERERQLAAKNVQRRKEGKDA